MNNNGNNTNKDQDDLQRGNQVNDWNGKAEKGTRVGQKGGQATAKSQGSGFNEEINENDSQLGTGGLEEGRTRTREESGQSGQY